VLATTKQSWARTRGGVSQRLALPPLHRRNKAGSTSPKHRCHAWKHSLGSSPTAWRSNVRASALAC